MVSLKRKEYLRKYMVEYRRRNRKLLNERVRIWQKNHPEYGAKYREKNRERIRAYNTAYVRALRKRRKALVQTPRATREIKT